MGVWVACHSGTSARQQLPTGGHGSDRSTLRVRPTPGTGPRSPATGDDPSAPIRHRQTAFDEKTTSGRAATDMPPHDGESSTPRQACPWRRGNNARVSSRQRRWRSRRRQRPPAELNESDPPRALTARERHRHLVGGCRGFAPIRVPGAGSQSTNGNMNLAHENHSHLHCASIQV
jgi:hypothetical protein